MIARPERTRELRSVLIQATETTAGYLDAPAWEPTPGSEGAAEIAAQEVGPTGPWGESPVRTAHSLVHALLDCALMHIRALALIYTDEPPAMAPTTVARSVMEAAATAWWIMEPGIGPRRRVARVTSERLRSAREAAKAIVHLEGPINASDYSESEKHVREYALALGLSAAENDPRIEKEVRPASTDLIALLLERDTSLNKSQARQVYPSYSGVAHGLLYGIMQYLRPVEAEEGIRLEWRNDDHIIDAVPSYTLAVLIAAMDRVLTVMGWDRSSWDGWKSTLYQHFAEP